MDMDEEYWSAVRAMRLGIADLLTDLSPAEWDPGRSARTGGSGTSPGHLASVPTITTWQMVAAARGPGSIRTASTPWWPAARDRAGRTRSSPGSASTPAIGARRWLSTPATPSSTWSVHSQDIALALGRDFPVPVAFSRPAWPGSGRWVSRCRARRKLAGLTLRADTDRRLDRGHRTRIGRAPALPLLLLLTGRTAAARAPSGARSRRR